MTDAIQSNPAEDEAVRLRPLTEATVAEICAQAAERGYHVGRVDLKGCWDKSTLLARTAKALQFPDWFGHNWDGWFDCLADLSWAPAPGYVIVLEHADELRRSSPEAFDTALAILQDAALVWVARKTPFNVFIGVAGNTY